MNVARATTTLTTLSDGKVLVAGGYDGTGPLPSAELFDPSDGTWTSTGSMSAGRGSHTLTLLLNGEVLVAGGFSPGVTDTAEIFSLDTERFTLSVTVTGPGTGTVTSDDEFINCGVDCSENYDSGSVVTLTAAAGAGSTFTGWSGDDCTGTDPCTLTIDAAKSVIATFVPSGRDLLVTAMTNPPSMASPGTLYLITQTTRNQGATATSISATRFYLSLDTVLNSGDKLLSRERVVPALEGGASDVGAHSAVTIPTNTALGTYFQLACADDKKVVVESNEGNNCRASVTTIQILKPDLLVTAVSNPPAQVAPGGKFNASDTVHNPSAVTAGASSTRYYLSLDAIKDAGDQLLSGSRKVDVLTSGASSAGNRR